MKRSILALGVVAGLTACGSSYEVEKKDAGWLPKVSSKSGIYYNLPRTEIIVLIPVEQTVKTSGKYGFSIDFAEGECKANPNGTFGIEEPGRPQYEDLKVGQAVLLTRPVADPDHRYFLSVEAELFSSFSHTVKLTDQGFLTSADTTVKDAKTELAIAAAQAVRDVFASVAGIAINGGAGSATVNASCQKFLAAQKQSAEIEDALEKLDMERKEFLFGKALNAKEANVDKVLAYFSKKEAALRSRQKAVGGDLNGTTKNEKFVLVGRTTPEAFTPITNGELDWYVARPQTPALDGEVPVLPNVPNPGKLDSQILAHVRPVAEIPTKREYRITVTPEIQYGADCKNSDAGENCKDTGIAGYRYRVPVVAQVELTQKNQMDSTQNKQMELTQNNQSAGKEDQPARITLASTEALIAQYGLIAKLPNKFGGAEGNLKLSVYTETGALQEVTVGAEPLPASTITDVSGLITETVEARRATKEAKAKADADAELKALTREKDILELKKTIRDLKNDLADVPAK